MARSHDALAQAIIDMIYKVLNRSDSPAASVQMGIWLATNALDSNLSKVQLVNGSTVDGVPRSSNATGLSANDIILLIRGPGVPLTILCKVVGDVSALQGG